MAGIGIRAVFHLRPLVLILHQLVVVARARFLLEPSGIKDFESGERSSSS
jgi:hypothetical protein